MKKASEHPVFTSRGRASSEAHVPIGMEDLLRRSLPPVEAEPHDLWPAMARRMQQAAAQEDVKAAIAVPWYDWALAAAVAALALSAPVSIPMLLYYL